MLIGFMRNIQKPQKFVRLLAKTTKYNGIDLVYFTANDVDIEREKINGRMLIENKWVRQEVPIPSFVDINVYCFKHKRVINFLQSKSTLSSGRFGPKDTVYQKVKEDGEFAHLIIPTKHITEFREFKEFLKEHGTIILKPRLGHKGEGIYKLAKQKGDYILTFGNQVSNLSKREIKEFFNNNINKTNIFFKNI